MKDTLHHLVEEARCRFGRISPCANKTAFDQCLTRLDDGRLVLWFNTTDGSTHVVIGKAHGDFSLPMVA